jgi:hypothetical protein
MFTTLTKTERLSIANSAIRKLGARRAREATRPIYPVFPNPTGFDGVDELPNGKYRARIRFCDALSGSDVRITLTSKAGTAEEAGYAYCMAHIHLWGGVSRYNQDIPTSELDSLIEGGR